METDDKVLYLSLLLTFVAGFCDTVTFIAADELFSAHVTGNFIVFAYHVVQDAATANWAKLLSFPVFVAAVVAGRWLAQKSTNHYALLLAEGGLLLTSGLLALVLAWTGTAAPWLWQLTAMTVVFALGLQNTFGKLFAKETYGPTTVMTGNVTQAALDVAERLAGPRREPGPTGSVKNQLLVIGGFLFGCLTGAIGAKLLGLWPVALPGLLLLGLAFFRGASNRETK
ncbi:YoaK family protein [Hymenobacter sp.]|uniref:YoaK family protein n=1 Tax=Hymenobacter sp. TaxID=1898978 RepID=UPI00286D4698|nr:YoaK family protein [Hymenobacter sp.]